MKHSTSNPPVELVVGADSTIGGALVRQLAASRRPALGTSRRAEATHFLALDLGDLPAEWTGPRVAVAYLCAGVTRLDACQLDPHGTSHINVAGNLALARQLVDQGAFVVFLSTSLVFDGTRAYRRTGERTCPFNEYGRQKAAVEQRLSELGDNVAALRLTKVLAADNALLAGWARSLSAGQPVRAFDDMVMAPLPVDCVAAALANLGQARLSGIWHLGGQRDMTYADAARLGAQLLGVASELVQAVPTCSVLADPPPRHTTLDCELLPERLNLSIPDGAATVLNVFRNLYSQKAA